jgi:hypothetical protein
VPIPPLFPPSHGPPGRSLTPAFDTEQVQKVLDKIDISNEVGLRDRALLGTFAYTFARIGAVVNLKVEDYFQTGKRSMIRFREKGGKETEIPVHHKLEELLNQYLEISVLRNRPTASLFPIAVGKTRKLGNRARRPELMQPECSNAGSKTPGCRMHSLPIPFGLPESEFPGERRNAGSGTEDRRPRRQPDNEALRPTRSESPSRRHGANQVLRPSGHV